MHQEDTIETVFRQPRIVSIARFDRDIVEALTLYTRPEPLQRVAVDVLGKHPALCSNAFCQANGVISIACADVGNGHPRFYFREVHHRRSLAAAVALRFGGELIAAEAGNWPIGQRKFQRAFRAFAIHTLAAGQEDARRQQCDCAKSAASPHSTSSTSTVSPVTRWASAAEMKGSKPPSSTSSGVGLVTPVRKSFTIW